MINAKVILIAGNSRSEYSMKEAAKFLDVPINSAPGTFQRRNGTFFKGYLIEYIPSNVKHFKSIYVYDEKMKFLGKEFRITEAVKKYRIAMQTLNKYLDSGKPFKGYFFYSTFQK